MGCVRSKSTNEEFIDVYFNSLKINQIDAKEFVNFIRKKKEEKLSEDDLAKAVNDIYFHSSDSTFETKKNFFLNLYNAHKGELEILYCATIFLTKHNVLNAEELKKNLVDCLEAFGLTNIYEKEEQCQLELIEKITRVYFNAVTLFAVQELQELKEEKQRKEFVDSMSSPFSQEVQQNLIDLYIKNTNKENPNLIDINLFIFITEDLHNQEIRQKLVDYYVSKDRAEKTKENRANDTKEKAELKLKLRNELLFKEKKEQEEKEKKEQEEKEKKEKEEKEKVEKEKEGEKKEEKKEEN